LEKLKRSYICLKTYVQSHMSRITILELGDWLRARSEVIASDIASRTLSTIESMEGTKSMYQIARETGIDFHSMVKALKKLERRGLVTSTREQGRRRQIRYSWTYLGVMLLPDLAPVGPRAGLISKVLGDWTEVVGYLSQQLQLTNEEATFLLNRILKLSYEFLNWLREEAILRKGSIPDLGNLDFYREQLLNFSAYLFTTAPELGLENLPVMEQAKLIQIGLRVLDQRRESLQRRLGKPDSPTVENRQIYG
jgi:DNA-binding MarR family transcriptional regulator